MKSRLISSATLRLAGTYLAIMLLMSCGFSVAMYKMSSREFDRPAPRLQLHQDDRLGGDLHDIFHDRAEQSRRNLLVGLLLLNGSVVVVGGLLSLLLARKSLEPIENAMEAQAQFVSDASHELRTPLTAMRAVNEVALRNPKLSLAAAKEVIQANSEETIKLQQLSDNLLNLAKQEHAVPPQLSSVELASVVTAALNQVIPAAQAKKIQIDDAVSRSQVSANEAMLTQALVILLDNAIKYSPVKSQIWITNERRGSYEFLRVRDAGAGISPKDLPHIFKRFYRADAARSGGNGYGLGLAIAQSLVEQQAGQVSVASQLGKGSVFTIRLKRSLS